MRHRYSVAQIVALHAALEKVKKTTVAGTRVWRPCARNKRVGGEMSLPRKAPAKKNGLEAKSL